jgi:hypothetical protein
MALTMVINYALPIVMPCSHKVRGEVGVHIEYTSGNPVLWDLVLSTHLLTQSGTMHTITLSTQKGIKDMSLK